MYRMTFKVAAVVVLVFSLQSSAEALVRRPGKVPPHVIRQRFQAGPALAAGELALAPLGHRQR